MVDVLRHGGEGSDRIAIVQENRASRPPVVGHGLTFEYDCSN